MGNAPHGDIRVLICEKLAERGVEALRAQFTVDDGTSWSRDELAEKIGAYDGIVVRSATKVTADLIERADNLKVIGRAGTGVDNVDLDAATRRGIVVVNAPESNSLSAAEHTIALILAQARNVAPAHARLQEGVWDRAKFGGIEVTGKTLGVIGLGRIGRLVAERALGLRMNVIAYDPFISESRCRELGVDHAETLDDVYAVSDFVTLHMPSTPETRGMINADSLAKMKPSARLINVARGDLVDEAALAGAVANGTIAGAAVDVFPSEPATESPLFGVTGITVTPHLGASTVEAQDRAGTDVAEQVVAALTGGVVTSAVNIPAVSAEGMAAMRPFIPLANQLGQLYAALKSGPVDNVEIICEGELADHSTRLITASALAGMLAGQTEQTPNLVNAPHLAMERGIQFSEATTHQSRDYTNRLTVRCGELMVSGTTVGTTSRTRLVGAFDQDIDIELAPHMGFARNRDVPGMIGKVGSVLGEAGINIASMAVSRGGDDGLALMAITVDSPVPAEAAEAISAIDGFEQVWFVNLDMGA